MVEKQHELGSEFELNSTKSYPVNLTSTICLHCTISLIKVVFIYLCYCGLYLTTNNAKLVIRSLLVLWETRTGKNKITLPLG